MGKFFIEIHKQFLEGGFVPGHTQCVEISRGLPEGSTLVSAEMVMDGEYLRLWYNPPEEIYLDDDEPVIPQIISHTTPHRRAFEALRTISAKVADYLGHDFPVSPEEMCVEFTELVEEIQHLVDPLVEDADE